MNTRVFLHGLVATLAAATLHAGPVASADFESGINVTTAWTAKDTVPSNAVSPPAVTLTPVAGARTNGLGAQFVRVSGRDQVQDGPQQGSFASNNLRNALTANGNGRTYSTRVWVRLDASAAEASVRCLLRWRDNSIAQIPLLLAERVLTAQDGWVEMKATAKLQWVTSLSAATIDFECEQLHRGTAYPPVATWFPSFDLDDLTMELDDDGDGLFNSEESTNHAQTTLPFSDDSDSDDDGIPDAWEKQFPLALNPRTVSDAALDSDGDGFTNLQEYHAATDPTDTNSFPGKHSDTSATFLARALLRALALAPSRGHTWSGQMLSDNVVDFDAYWTPLGLAQNGARFPAILSLAVEGQIVPLQIAASVDRAIAQVQAGGVPLVKWAAFNPWRAHLANNQNINGKPGDQVAADITGLLDPAYATALNVTPLTPPPGATASNQVARSIFDGWIDSVAAEIKRYNTATGGTPMLFRPLSEMNGAWFWWGHRTLGEYKGLWNHIRDRLTLPAPLGHDLHNLIWVYESASSEHLYAGPVGSSAASDYYYPGDDRVDCFGHNFYDDDWVLSWDANKVYRAHPKVYCVPQAGPGKVASPAHTFSNDIYLVRIPAAFPRLSFVIPWNDFDSQDDDDKNPATPDSDDDGVPGTDTPTHKYLSIVSNGALDGSAARFMTDARIITRDGLLWRPPTAPAASTVSSTALSLAWSAEPSAGSYRVERSANGVNGWLVAGTPVAGPQTVGGLAVSSITWLRVRSLFTNGGDSLPTDAVSATTWSLFQQWKNDALGNFNAPDLADDDNDGLVSLLEYGLSTNPLASSRWEQPVHGITNLSGADYLTLAFRRRIGANGVSYIVESTSDLVTGPWLPQPMPFGVPVDNGDASETVIFRDIIPIGGATSRFLRLRVSTP